MPSDNTDILRIEKCAFTQATFFPTRSIDTFPVYAIPRKIKFPRATCINETTNFPRETIDPLPNKHDFYEKLSVFISVKPQSNIFALWLFGFSKAKN